MSKFAKAGTQAPTSTSGKFTKAPTTMRLVILPYEHYVEAIQAPLLRLVEIPLRALSPGAFEELAAFAEQARCRARALNAEHSRCRIGAQWKDGHKAKDGRVDDAPVGRCRKSAPYSTVTRSPTRGSPDGGLQPQTQSPEEGRQGKNPYGGLPPPTPVRPPAEKRRSQCPERWDTWPL